MAVTFSAIGQNYVLKDKKVSIEANEWLVPIEKAYPALEAKFKRLELDKNLDIASRNAQYAELILSWGDVVEDVRTVFEERNDVTLNIPVLLTAEDEC